VSNRARGACVFLAVLAAAETALLAEGRIDAANARFSNMYGATAIKYSLRSKLLGRRLVEVGIVPASGGTRPLLILLHGRHDVRGRFVAFPQKSGPESMLSNALFAAIAQLGERAPIVVLLNGGSHSWYHDRRDGRWSSMILNEAIPDAIRRFHVAPGRIAIGGISMGGYGALHLAALRPHAFCAVGAHSAAVYETFRAAAPAAFDNAADFARNDVLAAARHGRFDRVPVWIDAGMNDPFHDADAALASVLRSRGGDVSFRSWPGAHTASYWDAHMGEYLRFYVSAFTRCSALNGPPATKPQSRRPRPRRRHRA
jgi:S-formylglutathione hydrolase FrmB